MSSTPLSLQERRKLHQRQQSTPVNFEAIKEQQIPPTIRPRANMHRRGQSFDLPQGHIHRSSNRPGSAVSTQTNNHGQQILREAQQQRMPKPGQPQLQHGRIILPQCAPYQRPPQIQEYHYNPTMDAVLSLQPDMTAHPQMQHIHLPISAIPLTNMTFSENSAEAAMIASMSPQYIPPLPEAAKRIPHPDLRVHTGPRPYTPMGQLSSAMFPITPVATPMGYTRRYRAEHDIISPRPMSAQTTRSLQGIAEHKQMLSFNENCDFSFSSSQAQEPTKQDVKLRSSKRSSTPSQPSADRPIETSTQSAKLENVSRPEFNQVPSSPTRPALSPRRIEIADLHLDPGISASIEETNISLDEIAQYIEGPDPADSKYTCTFEDCDKRFGRKENIKSHVQTHLGDRQFKCDHCLKRFVRGHDLKRHAKIHTGKKGYTCLCGNAFARHDALTRHRQRGMCVGAIDGIVRKEIKRGRPRKHRPEMEDRLHKSAKTRNSHIRPGSSQVDVYNSSASSCSISSWGSPVTEPLDHLSTHGGYGNIPSNMPSLDDAMNLFGLTTEDIFPPPGQHGMMFPETAPMPNKYTFTPPASPEYSCGSYTSPAHRTVSPVSGVKQPAQTGSGLVGTDISINDYALPDLSLSSHGRMLQSAPLPHVSPIQLHAQLSAGQEMYNGNGSLPALSHSSSPPPESLSQSTNAANSMIFDFNSGDHALRMSTMSNISGLDFGMSMSKIPLPDFTPSNHEAGVSTKNDFDSFLNMDDSQMNISMNGSGSEDTFLAH